jgi:hypothetical protein
MRGRSEWALAYLDLFAWFMLVSGDMGVCPTFRISNLLRLRLTERYLLRLKNFEGLFEFPLLTLAQTFSFDLFLDLACSAS